MKLSHCGERILNYFVLNSSSIGILGGKAPLRRESLAILSGRVFLVRECEMVERNLHPGVQTGYVRGWSSKINSIESLLGCKGLS